MWAKRLLAVAAAVGLIAGAVFARDQWIDDGGDESPPSDTADRLVCASELIAVCLAAADETGGVEVVEADVGATIEELSAAAPDSDTAKQLWLTLAPFPEIVEQTRAGARDDPLGLVTEPIATSDLVMVVATAKAQILLGECGDPVDWRCVGNLAGSEWNGLGDGSVTTGTVRPAFAPLGTGLGRLSVAAPIAAFFDGRTIDATDLDFINWLRRLVNVNRSVALSAGTPIGTILTRPSALDVAIGAAAELGNPGDPRFDTIYAGEMNRIDVVLAVPEGVRAPTDLPAALRRAAENLGWSRPGAAVGQPFDATTVTVATQIWSSTR